jgi:hypothetical protein
MRRTNGWVRGLMLLTLAFGSMAVATTGANASVVSPNSVNFGGVTLYATTTGLVNVTVDVDMRLGAITGSGTVAPFAATLGTCDVANGFTGPGTCAISVSFTPSAVGTVFGVVHLDVCGVEMSACETLAVNVAGTGMLKAKATPAAVNLGNVRLNTTKTKLVALTIDPDWVFTGIAGAAPSAPFALDFGTCDDVPGGFPGPGVCKVAVSFTPSLLGPAAGGFDLRVCPNGIGACRQVSVTLFGVAIPAIKATPNPLNFGDVAVGSSKLKMIQITPDVGFDADVFSYFPVNYSPEIGGTCGQLPQPSPCTLAIRFTPTAPGVAASQWVLFECPEGGGQCVPVHWSLRGNGV